MIPQILSIGRRTKLHLTDEYQQIPSYEYPVAFTHLKISFRGLHCLNCGHHETFHLSTELAQTTEDFIAYHCVCPDSKGLKYYR